MLPSLYKVGKESGPLLQPTCCTYETAAICPALPKTKIWSAFTAVCMRRHKTLNTATPFLSFDRWTTVSFAACFDMVSRALVASSRISNAGRRNRALAKLQTRCSCPPDNQMSASKQTDHSVVLSRKRFDKLMNRGISCCHRVIDGRPSTYSSIIQITVKQTQCSP